MTRLESWHVTEGGAIVSSSGSVIAPITDSTRNARLMAAAAELLEALQDAVLEMADLSSTEPRLDSILQKARAAIAKATATPEARA